LFPRKRSRGGGKNKSRIRKRVKEKDIRVKRKVLKKYPLEGQMKR